MVLKNLTMSALLVILAISFCQDSSASMVKRARDDAASAKESKRAEVVTLLDLRWSKAQAASVASKFIELNNVLGSLQVSGLSVLGSGFEPSHPGFDPFKINLNRAFLPNFNMIQEEMMNNLKYGLSNDLKSLELSYPKGGKLAVQASLKMKKDFQDQFNILIKVLPKKLEILNRDILNSLTKEGSGYQNIFADNGKRFDMASRSNWEKMGLSNFTQFDRSQASITTEALFRYVGIKREEFKSAGVFDLNVDRGLMTTQLLLINNLLSSLPVSELTTLGSGFEPSNRSFNPFKFDLGGRSFLPNTKILDQEVELTTKLGFERDRKILEASILKKKDYENYVKKLEANYKKSLLGHKNTISKIDQANKIILKNLSKTGFDKALIINGEQFFKATQAIFEKKGIRSFLELQQQVAQDSVDQLYGGNTIYFEDKAVAAVAAVAADEQEAEPAVEQTESVE